MTDPDILLARRVRYLPDAIERAEAKLQRLQAEALHLGMSDLASRYCFDDAWERAVETEKAKAAMRGQDNTMYGMDSLAVRRAG